MNDAEARAELARLEEAIRVEEEKQRPPLPRAGILREAEKLTCGDRNNSYGPPTQDFQRTAAILNAMGYRGISPGEIADEIREIKSHDVAIIIAAVKMSRLAWTPGKRDSWVDLAGYAACGYECVMEEEHN